MDGTVDSSPDAPAPRRPLPVRRRGAAHWAAGQQAAHGGRRSLGGLAVLAAVFATWSFVAHLAVESLQPVTVEMVLAALDAGNFEEAKATVGEMQPQAATPRTVGRRDVCAGRHKGRRRGTGNFA